MATLHLPIQPQPARIGHADGIEIELILRDF